MKYKDFIKENYHEGQGFHATRKMIVLAGLNMQSVAKALRKLGCRNVRASADYITIGHHLDIQ